MLNWHNLCMNECKKNTVIIENPFSEKGLALYINPMFFAILFSVYFKCSFHERFSPKRTPRNYV